MSNGNGNMCNVSTNDAILVDKIVRNIELKSKLTF